MESNIGLIKNKSCTVKDFLKQYKAEEWLSTTEIHNEYTYWCLKKGIVPLNIIAFGRKASTYQNEGLYESKQIKGKKKKLFKGVTESVPQPLPKEQPKEPQDSNGFTKREQILLHLLYKERYKTILQAEQLASIYEEEDDYEDYKITSDDILYSIAAPYEINKVIPELESKKELLLSYKNLKRIIKDLV